jgi:hypothetical protein
LRIKSWAGKGDNTISLGMKFLFLQVLVDCGSSGVL